MFWLNHRRFFPSRRSDSVTCDISLRRLQDLTSELESLGPASESNSGRIVEALRAISEVVIYGENRGAISAAASGSSANLSPVTDDPRRGVENVDGDPFDGPQLSSAGHESTSPLPPLDAAASAADALLPSTAPLNTGDEIFDYFCEKDVLGRFLWLLETPPLPGGGSSGGGGGGSGSGGSSSGRGGSGSSGNAGSSGGGGSSGGSGGGGPDAGDAAQKAAVVSQRMDRNDSSVVAVPLVAAVGTGVIAGTEAIWTCPASVQVQVIQSTSMLVMNVRRLTSLFSILSRGRVAALAAHRYGIGPGDDDGEEVLSHYVSLLKTLSLRLDAQTVHFFFRGAVVVNRTGGGRIGSGGGDGVAGGGGGGCGGAGGCDQGRGDGGGEGDSVTASNGGSSAAFGVAGGAGLSPGAAECSADVGETAASVKTMTAAAACLVPPEVTVGAASAVAGIMGTETDDRVLTARAPASGSAWAGDDEGGSGDGNADGAGNGGSAAALASVQAAFPLYWRAIQHIQHADSHVRIAALTAVLSIYGVEDDSVKAYLGRPEVQRAFFEPLVDSLRQQCRRLAERIAATLAPAICQESIAKLQDQIYYLQDLYAAGVGLLNDGLTRFLLCGFIKPVILPQLHLAAASGRRRSYAMLRRGRGSGGAGRKSVTAGTASLSVSPYRGSAAGGLAAPPAAAAAAADHIAVPVATPVSPSTGEVVGVSTADGRSLASPPVAVDADLAEPADAGASTAGAATGLLRTTGPRPVRGPTPRRRRSLDLRLSRGGKEESDVAGGGGRKRRLSASAALAPADTMAARAGEINAAPDAAADEATRAQMVLPQVALFALANFFTAVTHPMPFWAVLRAVLTDAAPEGGGGDSAQLQEARSARKTRRSSRRASAPVSAVPVPLPEALEGLKAFYDDCTTAVSGPVIDTGAADGEDGEDGGGDGGGGGGSGGNDDGGGSGGDDDGGGSHGGGGGDNGDEACDNCVAEASALGSLPAEKAPQSPAGGDDSDGRDGATRIAVTAAIDAASSNSGSRVKEADLGAPLPRRWSAPPIDLPKRSGEGKSAAAFSAPAAGVAATTATAAAAAGEASDVATEPGATDAAVARGAGFLLSLRPMLKPGLKPPRRSSADAVPPPGGSFTDDESWGTSSTGSGFSDASSGYASGEDAFGDALDVAEGDASFRLHLRRPPSLVPPPRRAAAPRWRRGLGACLHSRHECHSMGALLVLLAVATNPALRDGPVASPAAADTGAGAGAGAGAGSVPASMAEVMVAAAAETDLLAGRAGGMVVSDAAAATVLDVSGDGEPDASAPVTSKWTRDGNESASETSAAAKAMAEPHAAAAAAAVTTAAAAAALDAQREAARRKRNVRRSGGGRSSMGAAGEPAAAAAGALGKGLVPDFVVGDLMVMLATHPMPTPGHLGLRLCGEVLQAILRPDFQPHVASPAPKEAAAAPVLPSEESTALARYTVSISPTKGAAGAMPSPAPAPLRSTTGAAAPTLAGMETATPAALLAGRPAAAVLGEPTAAVGRVGPEAARLLGVALANAAAMAAPWFDGAWDDTVMLFEEEAQKFLARDAAEDAALKNVLKMSGLALRWCLTSCDGIAGGGSGIRDGCSSGGDNALTPAAAGATAANRTGCEIGKNGAAASGSSDAVPGGSPLDGGGEDQNAGSNHICGGRGGAGEVLDLDASARASLQAYFEVRRTYHALMRPGKADPALAALADIGCAAAASSAAGGGGGGDSKGAADGAGGCDDDCGWVDVIREGTQLLMKGRDVLACHLRPYRVGGCGRGSSGGDSVTPSGTAASGSAPTGSATAAGNVSGPGTVRRSSGSADDGGNGRGGGVGGGGGGGGSKAGAGYGGGGNSDSGDASPDAGVELYLVLHGSLLLLVSPDRWRLQFGEVRSVAPVHHCSARVEPSSPRELQVLVWAHRPVGLMQRDRSVQFGGVWPGQPPQAVEVPGAVEGCVTGMSLPAGASYPPAGASSVLTENCGETTASKTAAAVSVSTPSLPAAAAAVAAAAAAASVPAAAASAAGGARSSAVAWRCSLEFRNERGCRLALRHLSARRVMLRSQKKLRICELLKEYL
ncbi:unnamed protein product [Phaeothamnion confervicola]